MALTFTNINPANGQPLGLGDPIAFTLSTDLSGGGVMVTVYSLAFDVEELAWDGAAFFGRFKELSVKTGNDFILRRKDGWITGGIALRVRELGRLDFVTIWTDGSGVPSNGVGVDGDYYLRTSNGQVFKKAAGVYSAIYTPIVGGGAVVARQTVTGPASYSILTTDHVIYVNTTGGAITLTLPAHGSTDRIFEIVDVAGNLGTNNCTIARNGGTGTIAGVAASYVMEAPWQVVRIASDTVSSWLFHN